MTVDLTALDAATKALLADPKAAASVKKYATVNTAVLHAMQSPSPSGALDDMRAIHMQALSSTGAVVTPDGVPIVPTPPDPVRSQTPPGFWSMLSNDSSQIYTNDDVSLVPDPRYGQVYSHRTNGQSHNPYWSSPTTVATELTQGRTITVGQFDWYGLSVKWLPGWDFAKVTDWASVFQFAYPTITSPPLGLFAGYGDQIYVQRYAGPVTKNASGQWVAAEYSLYSLGKQSTYVGHWLEFLVGVKWGSHSDGEIHVQMRCKDLGDTAFREVVTQAGLNTWQWGGSSNVPQDPNGLAVCDKLDSYWGFLPGVTHANCPEVYVKHTGHVRCADKATAVAYMDAS